MEVSPRPNLRFAANAALLLGSIIFSSTYLGIIVQNVGFIRSFDNFFYKIFATGYHSGLIETIISPISHNFLPSIFGQVPSFLYVIALAFFLYILIWKREKLVVAIVTYLLALSTAAGSLWLSTFFVNRNRPFLTLANKVPQDWQNIWIHFTSWPSGHVRDAAVLATIIGYFLPKTRWFMVLLVVFVAWSRLYLGAHFPTDVIGGALIGFLVGVFAIYTVEFIKGKIDEKKK